MIVLSFHETMVVLAVQDQLQEETILILDLIKSYAKKAYEVGEATDTYRSLESCAIFESGYIQLLGASTFEWVTSNNGVMLTQRNTRDWERKRVKEAQEVCLKILWKSSPNKIIDLLGFG